MTPRSREVYHLGLERRSELGVGDVDARLLGVLVLELLGDVERVVATVTGILEIDRGGDVDRSSRVPPREVRNRVVIANRIAGLNARTGNIATVVEAWGRLAQIQPHGSHVERAPLGLGVIGVLVAIKADLTRRAADLDARALTFARSRRRDLDVGVAEGRAH